MSMLDWIQLHHEHHPLPEEAVIKGQPIMRLAQRNWFIEGLEPQHPDTSDGTAKARLGDRGRLLQTSPSDLTHAGLVHYLSPDTWFEGDRTE